MNLEPLLRHVHLKDTREKWKPNMCPLKPKNIEREQTWNLITQINFKNETYRIDMLKLPTYWGTIWGSETADTSDEDNI